MSEKTKCTVRDGRFVEPCKTLSDAVDNYTPGFSKTKGVFRLSLTNLETGEPSRTYFGIKSKKHPNGLCFNVCPWCGEDISEPFMPKEEGDS